MSWEPRPIPETTPETAPYWEGATEGSLLIRECNRCGLIHFYPRHRCPDCHSENVDWLESEGIGSVYSYSTVEKLSGWPESELPVILAYVELDEGPRVVSNIVDCPPEAVEIGMETRVRFVPTERMEIAIPVFEPRG